jgi:hypothetical protein
MDLSPKQIQQMIDMLQLMLDNQSSETNTEVEDEPTPTKTKKSNFYNKFSDMPEKNMHKEDVEIDQRLQQKPPMPRTRKTNLVSVKCRVCGKQDKVSPSLVISTDRYKCNKCSISAG